MSVRTDAFLERDDAVRLLRTVLDRARGGIGQIALVTGEAGVGKSQLMERFTRDHAGGCRVLRGGCDAMSTRRPLGPLVDMAGQLASLDRALDENAQSFMIFATLHAELSQSAMPTVLVIEDVHWADHATLDLIQYLGRRIARCPALLVLTYREEDAPSAVGLEPALGELPQSHTVRLPLRPLSAQAVAELARDDPRPADTLYALTQGNPFFLTELLAEPGSTVAPSIRAAVNARLSRLSASAREVCELVSVVPGVSEVPLIGALYPAAQWRGWHGGYADGGEGGEGGEAGNSVDSGDSPLDECVRNGVLRAAQGGITFRHELARLTVEHSLLPHRKQQLHARVLDWLTETLPLARARRVHHASEAGLGQAVLTLAPDAAADATRLGAHREATAVYSAALQFADTAAPAQRARILEGWAVATGVTDWLEKGTTDAMERAVVLWRELGEIERAGAALRLLSSMYHARWQITLSEHRLAEAIALLQAVAPGKALAEAYAQRAHFHMENDDTDATLEWSGRAIALSREVGADRALASALASTGGVLLRSTRDLPGGEATLRQSIGVAVAGGHFEPLITAYICLCEPLIRQYRFDDAERSCAEAMMVFQDAGVLQHFFIGLQAQLALARGHLDAAVGMTAEPLRRWPLQPTVMQWPLIYACGLARSRLDAHDGVAMLRQALAMSLVYGLPHFILMAGCALVETLGFLGERTEAAVVLRQIWARRGADTEPWTVGQLLAWAQRLDVTLDGRDGSDPAEAYGIAEGYQLELEGDFDAAAAYWESVGAPFERALCLLRGGPAGVLQAVEIFAALGARSAEAQARAEARRQGIRGIKRGPYGDARADELGLTTRQREVLALLTEGLSNAQISARLHRSERTVEHHVSRLLERFGAGNRTELAARARTAGAAGGAGGARAAGAAG